MNVFYYLYFLILPVLFIFHEIKVLSNPLKFKTALLDIKNVSSMEREDQGRVFRQAGCFLLFIYAIWLFIGLATFMWPFFVLFLIFSLVPKSKTPVWYVALDAVISILFLIFIILNAFHFKIGIEYFL